MYFKTSILAAVFGLAMASAASAATYSFTEGNGQNRALVAGSTDLDDASGGGTGFILNDIGGGESLGIYGRIVGGVDRFTFTSTSVFDVSFDFDGYDLDGGGSVGADFSGLVDQNFATSSGQQGAAGGKGVTISLLDDLSNVVGSQFFITNVTTNTLLDPTIFGGIGPGTYTLVVDGTDGPARRRAALYDIEVASVPLPAAGFLLLAGLGGLVATRRKAQ